MRDVPESGSAGSASQSRTLSALRRLLRSLYGRCRELAYGARLAYYLSARAIRLRLVAAGFPVKREFLVLHCMGGIDASGFFSEFAAVLGALEHYDHWKAQYAGLHVYFGPQGLYYDSRFGENWWEYYFEAIEIGSRHNEVVRIISPQAHDRFAGRVEREMPRATGASLIEAYVRPTARIQAIAEAYARSNFENNFVIGIHYRGTDKHSESPRIPYDQVRAAALDSVRAARTERYRIYLATDEQAFLDYMLGAFPDKLLYRKMKRSIDGSPIHRGNGNNHQKGEDAVIDCLLLSRSQHLIRTVSYLSLIATMLCPRVRETLLRREK